MYLIKLIKIKAKPKRNWHSNIDGENNLTLKTERGFIEVAQIREGKCT